MLLIATSSKSVHPHIVQQTGSENTQIHQVQDINSIELQILLTNLQGNV